MVYNFMQFCKRRILSAFFGNSVEKVMAHQHVPPPAHVHVGGRLYQEGINVQELKRGKRSGSPR